VTSLEPGTRVRTQIDLTSADWHPQQPDIPAGSLGTIDSIHRDQFTGRVMSYGVMLDDSVDRLAAAMNPDEIEPVIQRITVLCAHCKRTDTAEIAPADFDAIAVALGHDTAATEED
jgi:hypothetical protein